MRMVLSHEHDLLFMPLLFGNAAHILNLAAMGIELFDTTVLEFALRLDQ